MCNTLRDFWLIDRSFTVEWLNKMNSKFEYLNGARNKKQVFVFTPVKLEGLNVLTC